MRRFRYDDVVTKRLVLRKFEENDILKYHEILVREHVGFEKIETKDLEATMNILEEFYHHWEIKGFGVWAIVEKKENLLMGHCGFKMNENLREIELVFNIAKEFKGKGYAIEAINAAMNYLNQNTSFKKFFVRPENSNQELKEIFNSLGMKEKCEKENIIYEKILI